MKLTLTSRVLTTFALLAIVSAPCQSIVAQTTAKASVVIAGVTDAQTGAPLAEAEVSVSDINVSARTDWSGEVRIPNVAAGKHKFEIRRAGYEPLDVDLLVQGETCTECPIKCWGEA